MFTAATSILAPMVGKALSRTFKIPYTVLTYGKEVWEALPPKDQKALSHSCQSEYGQSAATAEI